MKMCIIPYCIELRKKLSIIMEEAFKQKCSYENYYGVYSVKQCEPCWNLVSLQRNRVLSDSSRQPISYEDNGEVKVVDVIGAAWLTMSENTPTPIKEERGTPTPPGMLTISVSQVEMTVANRCKSGKTDGELAFRRTKNKVV